MIASVDQDEQGVSHINWLGTRKKKSLNAQLDAHMGNLSTYAQALIGGDNNTAQSLYSALMQDSTSKQEADMLREAIANGQQYDTVLKQVRKSKEDAIKSTTGFKGALKNLGGVAKTVGASLLQGIASMAISWAINAAIDAIDKQVNAVKYAKEALAEYADEWQVLQDKQKSAGDLVRKYETDYERLSKGVNMVTGENLSLSDDEYELFKQINSELADSALSTVEGITVAYDAQGQAIVRLSGQMDSLGDAYKALEQQTRTDILKTLPEAYENYVQTQATAANDIVVGRDDVDALVQETLQIIARSKDETDAERQVYELVMQRYGNSFLLGPGNMDLIGSYLGHADTLMESIISFDLGDYIMGGKSQSERQAEMIAKDLISVAENWESAAVSFEAKNAYAYEQLAPALRTYMQYELEKEQYSELTHASRQIISHRAIEYIPSDALVKQNWAEATTMLRQFAEMFANGSDLQKNLEAANRAQSEYAKDVISVGEYREAVSLVLDDLEHEQDVLPGFIDMIGKLFDFDDASSIERAKRRADKIISDATEEWFADLTKSEVDFIMTLDHEQTMSMAAYQREYAEAQKTEEYVSSKLASTYADTKSGIAVLQEVWKAQGYSAAITAEQYEKLVEAGEEYAACVKNVNGYMQLDIDATNKLIASKNAEAKATVEAAKAHSLQKYQDNLFMLQAYNAALQMEDEITETSREILNEKIDALEAENALIKKDIDVYNRLGSEIEYASSAYKKWLDAQDAPEAGDAYANMLTAMEQIQEGQDSGKIGTVKYKAAVELLVPDGQIVSAQLKKLSRYLTEDKEGLQHFIDDMYGDAFLSKDSNGRYSFMKGVTIEDIAAGLGLTEETVQYMLQALEDYGWNVDIFDTKYSSTEALKVYEQAAKEVQNAEEELARIKADADATAAERAAAEQKAAEARAKQIEAAAHVEKVADAPLTDEEKAAAMVKRYQELIDTLEALQIPVEGVIKHYYEAPDSNDPSDYVKNLDATIGVYSDAPTADPSQGVSALSAHIDQYISDDDPNMQVSNLQAGIGIYSDNDGVDPEDNVSALNATVVNYVDGAEADPNDNVSQLTGKIARYEDGVNADPNKGVQRLNALIDAYSNTPNGASQLGDLTKNLAGEIEGYGETEEAGQDKARLLRGNIEVEGYTENIDAQKKKEALLQGQFEITGYAENLTAVKQRAKLLQGSIHIEGYSEGETAKAQKSELLQGHVKIDTYENTPNGDSQLGNLTKNLNGEVDGYTESEKAGNDKANLLRGGVSVEGYSDTEESSDQKQKL